MTETMPSTSLVGRLAIPVGTRAVLFDMDGVLIDSLAQDYAVVGELLAPYRGGVAGVPRDLVRRWFALALDDFWPKLSDELGLGLSAEALATIVARHERLRLESPPVVHRGVVEILEAVRAAGLRCAVVSNNPRSDILRMLAACGLLARVDEIVGNDERSLARKPAPDPYLAAAKRLDIPASACVAVEDSVLGLESAHRAGCYTVGVATGADTLEKIIASGFANSCYPAFDDDYGDTAE